MEKFLEESVQRATQHGHHFQGGSYVNSHQAKTSATAQVPSLWYERVSKLQAYDRRMPTLRSCQECYQHQVRAEQCLVASAAKSIFKVGMDYVRSPQITRPPRRATSCHQQLGYADNVRPGGQSWTSWQQAAGHCFNEPAPCSELTQVSFLPASNPTIG